MKQPVAVSATGEITLADLRLFAKAAESASLARAAEALGISKATATRQLQRLESTLGQRLLHRSAGRFSLTEEGREFLSKMGASLRQLDDAVAVCQPRDGRLKGRLRITAPFHFGRLFIAPRIAPILSLHPDLSIHVDLSCRKVDLMADEADLAIRIGSPGPAGENLVARLIGRSRLVLCATPSYLAASLPLQCPQDLAAHRLLDFRSDPGNGEFALTFSDGREATIAAAVVLRANEPGVLAEAVRHGAGIAYIPDIFVTADLAAGVIVEVLTDWPLPRLDINAVYAPGRRQSPKIRAFLDYLVSTLRVP